MEIEKGCEDIGAKEMLKKMYMTEFNEPCLKDADPVTKGLKEISYDDKRFLKIMQKEISKVGKHHQLPLPLRNNNMSLPNNRDLVEKTLMHLKKWFEKDCKFYEDYNKFTEKIITKGYGREAKTNSPDGRTWYLPHHTMEEHGIYHSHKPSKLRVVFDCSAELNGRSINKELLPGPDLANKLVGVLAKFRENKVAFMADIEKMYFRTFAAEQHRSLLQFLWWKEGNIPEKPIDDEMCVHVFGGVSSGACSNSALKITAVENKDKFGEEAAQTLQNNFYVDNLLKSVANEDIAVQLIKIVTGICHEGGYNLTKFTSNSKRVLQSISDKDRQSGVKDKDLVKNLPEDQVLGVLWNIEDDAFGFKVALKGKPVTRRGVLSVLSSVYDPLGFGTPFLLKGKQILQKLCEQGLKWDEELPKETAVEWIKWKDKLSDLESVHMKRCFTPPTFGKTKDCSLHYFSDACKKGYGQVTYLCAVDKSGKVHSSLVMGKAQVAPLKYITIPRMELVAAALSVKNYVML